jgi:A/G-specific adenine glycosylase
MDFFKLQIHHWYYKFKRNLPWRTTQNPYFVWLSEIILQQTRVNQGLNYHFKFVEEFPTVNDLANASEDQVLKLWQGLGYYSRARNLHFTAKYIKDHYNGNFPDTYHNILMLKGIGDYTAAAIASISFNEQVAAVDGNVFRVLSRYYGISQPIDSTTGKKIFKELANELILNSNPGMHNQAMIDFCALQCTPQKPECTICPLKEHCFAFLNDKISDLPVKLKKIKQRNRYFNYFVLFHEEFTWIKKRVKRDIWKNLYEFPMIETETNIPIDTLFLMSEVKEFLKVHFVIEKIEDWKIHLLTHQRINYRIIKIRLISEVIFPDEFIKVNKADIINFAIPKLLETYTINQRF